MNQKRGDGSCNQGKAEKSLVARDHQWQDYKLPMKQNNTVIGAGNVWQENNGPKVGLATPGVPTIKDALEAGGKGFRKMATIECTGHGWKLEPAGRASRDTPGAELGNIRRWAVFEAPADGEDIYVDHSHWAISDNDGSPATLPASQPLSLFLSFNRPEEQTKRRTTNTSSSPNTLYSTTPIRCSTNAKAISTTGGAVSWLRNFTLNGIAQAKKLPLTPLNEPNRLADAALSNCRTIMKAAAPGYLISFLLP
ncbi:hypothetical protein PAAG_02375 [Paracoccidioides lutzii Pb01]|uniref:Uncharacterized protein n=1 Tax=Paracoccidioides lutzii (strain ATCC MYA-826 / Pb01) TaxID=502779 RepID=C1GUQ2_PARBA|nr:hypothetical protein PAAG_02375 [Paracoccidioides lutzii Pb01]EEH40320.2 hypothetical protein PAAG_02375 [Paracoccidioides lutzii Pb01]